MDWHWYDLGILGLMALLTLRPGFLDGPLEKFEEAVHLSWAQALFHGKLPYRDYYTNYGPLYTLHFYVLHRLLGRTLRTHRLTMAVGNYLSLAVAYSCGMLLTDAFAARLAMAVALPLICLDQRYLTCWGGFRMGAGLCFAFCLILALQSGGLLPFFLCGLLMTAALLFSVDEGVAAAMSMALVIGLHLLHPELFLENGLLALASFAAGGLLGAGCFVWWLVRHRALRGYYEDTVIGTLRMLSWRGGSTHLPKPLVGKSGAAEISKALFTEEAFFYWSMLTALSVSGIAIYSLQPLADAPARQLYPTLTLLCFGLMHLASSWRLATGPQFKTFLPAFVVLGCALAFGQIPTEVGAALGALLAVSTASSGNIRFLVGHYRARWATPVPLARYSGVLMPAPMADFLERLEAAIRRHAQSQETLFVPYDCSMSFFAEVPFYSRSSVTVGESLIPGRQERLLQRLREDPPALVVEEVGAPNLLPSFSSRERLREVYDMLAVEYHDVAVIAAPTIDREFRDRVIAMWPGGWFWFDEHKGFAMRSVLLKKHNAQHRSQ